MISSNLKSFAKINIGLRILRKREDGYHDLETIFYPLKLYDEIKIQIEPNTVSHNSVVLTSNKSFIPLNNHNLCYIAVEKFFRIFEIKDFYRINIELVKKIPVGGGLGGGSSNAATILKFLVNYFSVDIISNKIKIIDLAMSIGSDVPFFLTMKPCYAEGRGERLKLLKQFEIDFNILIVNPNLHISTKWAFENLNIQPGIEKKRMLQDIATFNPSESEIFENDFEEIVFRKYKILKEIKTELLDKGAVYSSMSGSGATMFGLFEKNNNTEIQKCRLDFKNKNYFTFIA